MLESLVTKAIPRRFASRDDRGNGTAIPRRFASRDDSIGRHPERFSSSHPERSEGSLSLRLFNRLVLTLGAFLLGGSAAAQTVTLQIKPRVGDTLRMRLDQQSEMTGVKRTANGESTALVVATMRMFSRAIVEGVVDKGTTVLAITDSVQMTSTDERTRQGLIQAEALMRGQKVRFNVSPDGTVGMTETGGVSRDVAQVVSLMPAAFPKGPINVGESWIREMVLPAASQLGTLGGKLHVTFRFDSLTHSGEWAFLSMRGEMQPYVGYAPGPRSDSEKGVVSGTMLVDQKRGWLTESWFTIVMNSVVTQPLASGGATMHVQTRITQHMHTGERR